VTLSLRKWRATRHVREPLNELDLRVIEMARADGPRSFNPDGIIAQTLRLLGAPVARRLANEGVEALRRFSVRAWYWDLIRTRDLQSLLAAGYSTAHVKQILAYVATFGGFSPSIQKT
jgi:hypothetical protein